MMFLPLSDYSFLFDISYCLTSALENISYLDLTSANSLKFSITK